jgi:flagellar motor switch protein FliG
MRQWTKNCTKTKIFYTLYNRGKCMSKAKDIVVTVYGHNDVIDNIAVSLFDKPDSGNYGSNNESNAETYCDALNKLKLEGESWVFAKIISENVPYSLDSFFSLKFDIILNLDDRALQKVLREVDYQELAKALEGEKESVKEKIFRNMSERAALMLKEDMEFMGPVGIRDAKKSQEKIMALIRHLEQTGEIVFRV